MNQSYKNSSLEELIDSAIFLTQQEQPINIDLLYAIRYKFVEEHPMTWGGDRCDPCYICGKGVPQEIKKNAEGKKIGYKTPTGEVYCKDHQPK